MWLKCALVLWTSVAFAEDALPWWRTANLYQVYPRSFKDSDGNGYGDLKGITQMVDYFAEIGVDVIWLNPIYKSPMVDFGYDISNYTDVDPLFGTMADFDELVAKCRKLDIKIVMDFVPNHSSDEHPWFQHSLNPADPLYNSYKDFYVWLDPKGTDASGNPIPPNNWIGFFGGPAWTYREERKQFYLHFFLPKQPDLNFRNPVVVSNMTDVINFWIDRGVDGFRVDAVAQLIEGTSFQDEAPVPGTAGNTFFTQQHNYEFDQPETFDLLKQWARVIKGRADQDGKPRAMVLEVYNTIPNTMRYYGTGDTSLMFPFNFYIMTRSNLTTRPADLKAMVDAWMTAMPSDGVANWAIGNHDNRRAADRFGPEMVDAINLFIGVLPGVKITYNGEEIGMRTTFIRWDQTIDPFERQFGPQGYMDHCRDCARTPMQWDNTVGTGFSTNPKPWLPVNPNYWWLNVAAQRAAPTSHLKVFQALAKARKDPVLQRGDYQVVVPNSDTLVVVRTLNRVSIYVLIINMGSDVLSYTSQGFFFPQQIDVDLEVVIGSLNCEYSPGFRFNAGHQNVTLRPKAAVLLRTPSSTSSSSHLSTTFVGIFTLLALWILHLSN